MNGTMTPYRRQILAALDHQIIEDGGLAATVLRTRIGYDKSANAFAGLLASMEAKGLIERDMAGRRTYSIGLTAKGRQVAQGLDGRTLASVVHLPVAEAACAGCQTLQAQIDRLQRLVIDQAEALNSRAAS